MSWTRTIVATAGGFALLKPAVTQLGIIYNEVWYYQNFEFFGAVVDAGLIFLAMILFIVLALL